MRSLLLFSLLFAVPVLAAPAKKFDATAPLRQFLSQKADFRWKVVGRDSNRFLLQLTSGKWKNTTWQHQIAVYEPRVNRHPDAATLFLATRAVPTDKIGGQLAADATGARFVVVHDVPNQPLWNRRENDLLGYGVQKSLDENDPTWSLAFPMTRTAVCAMDAVDFWSRSQKKPIKRWILLGFSKRALATWLASPDARVAGLVSVGYNNLNLPAQAKLQKRDWGALSRHWQKMVPPDYQKRLETSNGQKLLATWDPWSFRAQMVCPRLLVDATNNDYWTLKSLGAFEKGLRGPTDTLYFANAGHFLEKSMLGLFQSSAAWIDLTLSRKTAPSIQLNFFHRQLILKAPGASQTKIRFATSQNRDFRYAIWREISLQKNRNGILEADFPPLPTSTQTVAFFGEGAWKGATPLKLTSKIVVLRRTSQKVWSED